MTSYEKTEHGENIRDAVLSLFTDTDNSLFSDIITTAIVVIPASYVWIATERIWIGLAVAAAMYLAYMHGYPLCMRFVTKENILRLRTSLKEFGKSRRMRNI